MASLWDTVDILGSIQKGRQMYARSAAERLLKQEDYEGAALKLAPFSPQESAAVAALGEQARGRRERREAETFDRDVAPMLASGDVAGAQRLALERRRPSDTVMRLMEMGRTLDNQRLAQMRERTARTALQIRSWDRLPEEERALAYEALRTRLIEEDPSTAQHLPEQYDPQVVQNLMYASVDAKDAFDRIDAERKAGLDERRVAVQEAQLGVAERRAAAAETTAQAALRRADRADAPPKTIGQTGLTSEEVALEMRLEDRWRGVYSNFKDIQEQFGRIQTMGNRADAAGDLALVVSFTKMLDPGSVAREGEVKLTQSVDSLLGQAQNFIPRLERGNTLLPPAVRNQLIAAAREMYGVYEKKYHDIATDYRRRAESYGVDPTRAMMGYRPIAPDEAPPAPDTPGTPTIRLDERGRRR